MKKKIIDILAKVPENQTLFLVNLSISPTRKISIIIDGDNGLPISECSRISRFISSALDKEELDYSIEVSSPGIDRPLQHLRQYKKNKNRKLRVTTEHNEIFEGTLTEVSDEKIVLAQHSRISKSKAKSDQAVEKRQEITYKEIKEARVQVIF